MIAPLGETTNLAALASFPVTAGFVTPLIILPPNCTNGSLPKKLGV